MGPRCSARGLNAATGRNKSERTDDDDGAHYKNANVGVSSRMVPNPNGAAFFAPMPAARAMGAMIGIRQLMQMTITVAMSQASLVGAGFGLSFKPQVFPSPSKPDPLLAEAEENSLQGELVIQNIGHR